MLFDDEEIRIMAGSLQPQLCDADYGSTGFDDILRDFFLPELFAGKTVLDLGPGQYDFTRMALAAGASVFAIDHDPAVVALGKKRGYEVMLADFLEMDWRTLPKVDGLFSRGAFTAQWFKQPGPMHSFIDEFCGVIKVDGWAWVAPWHGPRLRADYPEIVEAERIAFERNGFERVMLAADEWRRYFDRYSPRVGFVDDPALLFIRGPLMRPPLSPVDLA